MFSGGHGDPCRYFHGCPVGEHLVFYSLFGNPCARLPNLEQLLVGQDNLITDASGVALFLS